MRKIETREGKMFLNDRPLYQRLVLDQGYFPEGILTAPTDEDLRRDIELAREMGYDGARKHQKVEDPRWLFWADTLGFLERYRSLVEALLRSSPVQGFCYTQLTDVEQEINGLLTYDRKPKVDPARVREINDRR